MYVYTYFLYLYAHAKICKENINHSIYWGHATIITRTAPIPSFTDTSGNKFYVRIHEYKYQYQYMEALHSVQL